MKKIISSLLASSALLSVSPAAFAAEPSVVRLGTVSTSATLCAGTRLDRVTTYKKWLEDFALDLFSQAALAKNMEALAQAKAAAFKLQSVNVKRGQLHLCGAVSGNW